MGEYTKRPGDVYRELLEAFPGVNIDVNEDGPFALVATFSKGGSEMALRYEDMPKLAAAFDTDKLDFGKTEDIEAYRWSSWTYDDGRPGQLFVRARYEDGKYINDGEKVE